MLSPMRAILMPWLSCHAAAARSQVATLSCTDPSRQCPTTTFRSMPSRVQM